MRNLAALVSVSVLLAAVVSARAQEIIRKPLAIGTKIETGQVVKGEPIKSGDDPDKAFLSRIAVSLTQEVTVDQHLEIKTGVGGVFYTVFPDVRGNAGSQGVKFGPGITQAQAAYKFGDVEKPSAILRVGFFPYKYNPDAKNLGEYLLRSMPYPSFTTTGSWSITDAAFVRAQGIQATFFNFDGKLKHDFLLTSERDFRPTGDFTPSYLTEFTAGPFQIGAGISLFHFLPLDGDRLKSRSMGEYSVYHYDAFPAFTVNITPGTFDDTLATPVVHEAGASLTLLSSDLEALRNEHPELAGAIDSLPRDTVEYTTKGIKLMARASFDIQKIVPLSFLGPQDLKIYAEAALLGVENQPGYWEKRSERVPFMVGINLPTFKKLDVLSFEMEYYGSPLPDDQEQVLINNRPIYENYSMLTHSSDNNRRDDWKWSLYASKTVLTGVSLRAQVANDHLRPIDQATTNFSGMTVMRNPRDWYYVVTVNFGI
jgi:hypothetical protein